MSSDSTSWRLGSSRQERTPITKKDMNKCICVCFTRFSATWGGGSFIGGSLSWGRYTSLPHHLTQIVGITGTESVKSRWGGACWWLLIMVENIHKERIITQKKRNQKVKFITNIARKQSEHQPSAKYLSSALAHRTPVLSPGPWIRSRSQSHGGKLKWGTATLLGFSNPTRSTKNRHSLRELFYKRSSCKVHIRFPVCTYSDLQLGRIIAEVGWKKATYNTPKNKNRPKKRYLKSADWKYLYIFG